MHPRRPSGRSGTERASGLVAPPRRSSGAPGGCALPAGTAQANWWESWRVPESEGPVLGVTECPRPAASAPVPAGFAGVGSQLPPSVAAVDRRPGVLPPGPNSCASARSADRSTVAAGVPDRSAAATPRCRHPADLRRRRQEHRLSPEDRPSDFPALE